jgi:hypothetical protein
MDLSDCQSATYHAKRELNALGTLQSAAQMSNLLTQSRQQLAKLGDLQALAEPVLSGIQVAKENGTWPQDNTAGNLFVDLCKTYLTLNTLSKWWGLIQRQTQSMKESIGGFIDMVGKGLGQERLKAVLSSETPWRGISHDNLVKSIDNLVFGDKKRIMHHNLPYLEPQLTSS